MIYCLSPRTDHERGNIMTDTTAINAIAAQIKDFQSKADTAIAAAIAYENKGSKERERAETLNQCAKDLEVVLVRLGASAPDSRGQKVPGNTKRVRLRYQEQGLTTDMIEMIFREPGIEKKIVLDALREKEDTRGTAGKLLKRAIENDDVNEKEGKLYMTTDGIAIWRQSPLFRHQE
jgi:hypothetical protein